ncbi:MAG: ABC transporter ATP-binding protein [Proteobacteria bacterium]|nr:ABC transporter ATP-binding protein [Pseudomonadota bacterium]
MSLLSISDLRVHYRAESGLTRAVDGVSFEVPEGQIVGLVGESGCGKTTVARAITGVMPQNAVIAGGRIVYRDRNLLELSRPEAKALRWREIAFIPQSAMNSLDPVYRVGAQVEEVLIARGGHDRRRAAARAVELFEMVGLDPGRLRDYPHQFSGGMRQRAAIAIALALNPKLVIADEPVTALDVIVQRQVLDTIKTLQARFQISVVLVTHDISVVAYACDQVVVMYAGQVVESGPAAAVLDRPVHPYTMGLYNAFPDMQSSAGMLVPIDGSPPDLSQPFAGCRFAPRCPFARDDCRLSGVENRPCEPGHSAACVRAAEAHQLRAAAREPATWLRS